MNARRNKTMANLDLLYQRIDEIRMNEADRLRAKASLARAEAVVDFIFEAAGFVGGHFLNLVLRPIQRLTGALG